MNCRNCGSELNPSAAICVQCGRSADCDGLFCKSCGNENPKETLYCLSCGVQQRRIPPYKSIAKKLFHAKEKSVLLAVVLTVLGGMLGVHNFYLNYTLKGILQALLFVAGLGIVSYIWAIIELVLILAGIIQKDGNGVNLAE